MINKQGFRVKRDGTPYWNCFCTKPELIENYDKAIADKEQTWICHHRNEKFYTSTELIDLGLYYNCPPCELIFLTVSEHSKEYHKGNNGEERKMKMSIAMKDNQNGKGHKLSDEHKAKLALLNKTNPHMLGKKHSEETKRKMSESAKNRQRHNN